MSFRSTTSRGSSFPSCSRPATRAFPVVGENKDDVVGILLAKELLNYYANPESFNLRDTLRPAVFVPESKRLNVLLRDFRANRNHIAIVVDEYGGVSGLVTIEDVLEQIVGDIEDEYDFDEAEDNIIPEAGGRYRVKAQTEIARFQRNARRRVQRRGIPHHRRAGAAGVRTAAQARRGDDDWQFPLQGRARRQPPDLHAASRAADAAAGRKIARRRGLMAALRLRRGDLARHRYGVRLRAVRPVATAGTDPCRLVPAVAARAFAAGGRWGRLRIRPGAVRYRRVLGLRRTGAVRGHGRRARRRSRPLFFCAYLALFPALGGWATARLARDDAAARLAAAAAFWTLAEWLRTWVYSGFPWLAVGYAQTHATLSGYAALGGVFLVSLAVATCAALLATRCRPCAAATSAPARQPSRRCWPFGLPPLAWDASNGAAPRGDPVAREPGAGQHRRGRSSSKPRIAMRRLPPTLDWSRRRRGD